MEHKEYEAYQELSGVERVLVASGLVFVPLLLVPGFLLPQLPSWGTPIEEISVPYAQHYTAFFTSRIIFGFASLFFLLFAGGLYGILRRAEGGAGTLATLAFGGGVAFAIMQYVTSGAQLGAIFVGGQGGVPETIYTLTGLSQAVGNYSGFTLAIFLAVASVCMLRTRVVPRWIGWVGLVSAASTLVGSIPPSDASPLVLLAFLGLILFVIWTLATSIVTLRRSRVRRTGSQTVSSQ